MKEFAETEINSTPPPPTLGESPSLFPFNAFPTKIPHLPPFPPMKKGFTDLDTPSLSPSVEESFSFPEDNFPSINYAYLSNLLKSCFSPTVPPLALEGRTERVSKEEPSQTSEHYARRLDQLQFEPIDNFNLKQEVRRRIQEWESQPKPFMLKLAVLMDKSEAEVEELLQQRIEELMESSQFFCACHTGVLVNHILDGDRRFKSMLEIRNPYAVLFEQRRSNTELELFGFPASDSDEGGSFKSSRPIYGYFGLDENGVLNAEGKHPPRNTVAIYGHVTVKIKKRVATDRATMSLSDSYFINAPVSPVALPHFSGFFYKRVNEYLETLNKLQNFLENPLDSKLLWEICGSYTEAHFHGGLTVDDIESVHLSLGNGVTQEEIDEITAAVETYNRETGSNIAVVVY